MRFFYYLPAVQRLVLLPMLLEKKRRAGTLKGSCVSHMTVSDELAAALQVHVVLKRKGRQDAS